MFQAIETVIPPDVILPLTLGFGSRVRFITETLSGRSTPRGKPLWTPQKASAQSDQKLVQIFRAAWVFVRGTDITAWLAEPRHPEVVKIRPNNGSLSIEVAGGRPPEASRFRLEVIGDRGTLVLDGGALRGFPMGRLRLSFNGEPQAVDEGETDSMPDTAANVAGIYAALRDDIAQGTSTAPDFDHAVRLARLVDDVLSSAQTGTRKSATDWPVQQ